MSREEEADRVIKSVYYKDIISGLSCVTNREAIIDSAILIEGDFKAPFLIYISIKYKKKRLTVLILLNIKC